MAQTGNIGIKGMLGPSPSSDDSLKSFDEQAVRLRHLSTNAEGRIEIIPVSRQKHLLRSQARWVEPRLQGPCEILSRNGSERDLKADGVERDGIQPVSTAGRNEVSSEPSSGHELTPTRRE